MSLNPFMQWENQGGSHITSHHFPTVNNLDLDTRAASGEETLVRRKVKHRPASNAESKQHTLDNRRGVRGIPEEEYISSEALSCSESQYDTDSTITNSYVQRNQGRSKKGTVKSTSSSSRRSHLDSDTDESHVFARRSQSSAEDYNHIKSLVS